MSKTPITAVDRIYHEIQEMIVYGEMKPGKRLVHRQLAAQFGTSRIPILETIRRLEGDGLVVSYPNYGAQVREWSVHEVEGVYLAREALEGVACRLFALNASRADKVLLEDYSQMFNETAAQGDFMASNKADVELHLHIVRSSKCDALYRLVENSCLITTSMGAVHNTTDSPVDVLTPVGAHDGLVHALVSGDSVSAETAGKKHISDALQKLLVLHRLDEITPPE